MSCPNEGFLYETIKIQESTRPSPAHSNCLYVSIRATNMQVSGAYRH